MLQLVIAAAIGGLLTTILHTPIVRCMRWFMYNMAPPRISNWLIDKAVDRMASTPEHRRVVEHEIPLDIDRNAVLLQIGMCLAQGFGLENQHRTFVNMLDAFIDKYSGEDN